jgi:hypothetical protein
MNGKQAKRLRRAAMGLATTLTEAGKDIKKDGYQVLVHENRFSPPVEEHDPKQPAPPSYQLLVRKDSLKGIYRALKSGKA